MYINFKYSYFFSNSTLTPTTLPDFVYNQFHDMSFMLGKTFRPTRRVSRWNMQQQNDIASSFPIPTSTKTQTSKAGGVKP